MAGRVNWIRSDLECRRRGIPSMRRSDVLALPRRMHAQGPPTARRSTRRRSCGRRGGCGSGSGPRRSRAWPGPTTAPGRASGLTFAELRAYEPGDDVRHLDWNVTARQGRPYVRRFVEERALTLWLIVDVSASLRFGPEGRTKADRAAQAAALLATAAIQNGDRVGPGPGQRPGRGRAAPGRGRPAPGPVGPGAGRHARRPRDGPALAVGLARLRRLVATGAGRRPQRLPHRRAGRRLAAGRAAARGHRLAARRSPRGGAPRRRPDRPGGRRDGDPTGRRLRLAAGPRRLRRGGRHGAGPRSAAGAPRRG